MKRLLVLHVVAAAVVAGCASTAPSPDSFVRTAEPNWAAIEVREGLEYEAAWQQVVDVLAKRFDLEMISREGGYVRTGWSYVWGNPGEVSDTYRVRVIVKFSPDRDVLELKTEANYLTRPPTLLATKGESDTGPGRWIAGEDTRLLRTVKMDIMGVVGRTTK